MKLGTKFSLIAIGIVVATSISLELISFLVFSRATHDLNKELFAKEVNRLILLAYEQDELFFKAYILAKLNRNYGLKTKIVSNTENKKNKMSTPLLLISTARL